MEKQFKFNEDVWGLFVTIIVAYATIIFTLGIGTPWAICRLERWKATNTTIEGRKIKFTGEGSDLLGKFLVGYFLTLITLGIYGIWFAVKMQKFLIENTEFDD